MSGMGGRLRRFGLVLLGPGDGMRRRRAAVTGCSRVLAAIEDSDCSCWAPQTHVRETGEIEGAPACCGSPALATFGDSDCSCWAPQTHVPLPPPGAGGAPARPGAQTRERRGESDRRVGVRSWWGAQTSDWRGGPDRRVGVWVWRGAEKRDGQGESMWSAKRHWGRRGRSVMGEVGRAGEAGRRMVG